MRGILIIIVLIAMLVVGVLVIQDMRTETVSGVDKQKVVEHARDVAKDADKASREAARMMENAMGKVREER